MFEIKSKGSGALPKALHGNFTTQREVYHAIDGYLDSLKKGPARGKTKDAGNG